MTSWLRAPDQEARTLSWGSQPAVVLTLWVEAKLIPRKELDRESEGLASTT